MRLENKNIQNGYRYIPDDFYWVKNLTPRIIKNIFKEAEPLALLVDISFLPPNQFARKRAENTTLAELLPLITRKQVDFFRFIVRRNFNWYLTLTDHLHIEDIICIAVRNIYKDSKEHFVFCYVPMVYFEKFRKKYGLISGITERK